MPTGSFESLLTQLTRNEVQLAHSTYQLSRSNVIPLVENRPQFARVLSALSIAREHRTRDEQTKRRIHALFLRHCNLFELTDLMKLARQQGVSIYVNIDHIGGVHADGAGLRYMAETMCVQGIASNNPRILALGKNMGLETIQRIFALDSTGLDAALESVDDEHIDLLDISPALVVPYIAQSLKKQPHPFLASGLLQTSQQVTAVIRAGAIGVLTTRDDV